MVFPLTCPVCKEKLPAGVTVCPKCKETLPFITQPSCMKCGKQLEHEEQEYCGDCSQYGHFYTQGIAIFHYNDAVQKAIYDLKYNNRRDYSVFFAPFMIAGLKKVEQVWHTNVLVPVPIHDRKRRKRGYNQAEELAEAMAMEGNFVVRKDLIYRVQETLPQKALSHKERYQNLQHAFAVDVEKCRGIDSVILVDDIYTTGSTVDHCAKLLRAAGISHVYYVAIAIGEGI